MSDREEPWYRHRLRVRYCETDCGGVTHHGSYVDWIEESRTEWIRARGKSYRDFEANGVFLFVSEFQVRYLRSTKFDDEVEVATRLVERGGASLTFEYVITLVDEDGVVARATTKLACVDGAGKIKRLPIDL